MNKTINIPKNTLKRLAHYHYYLKQLRDSNREFVSTERLAYDLALSIGDVREDLENLQESLSITDIHNVEVLLSVTEKYLGYNQQSIAYIIGAGNLGRALLNYPGFKTCGLDILALFDSDTSLIGNKIGDKEVFSVSRLGELTHRMKVNIGIITTPPEPAQGIANVLVENGIKGIWNFSSAILKVPENIVLRNTSLYGDYLQLIHQMGFNSNKMNLN